MAREFTCPKCGADITDSYVEDDPPDVGISGGWYCDDCQEGYPCEEPQYDPEVE